MLLVASLENQLQSNPHISLPSSFSGTDVNVNDEQGLQSENGDNDGVYSKP